jgi:hypothetical protein
MDVKYGALTLHMGKTSSAGIVSSCDKSWDYPHSHSSMLYGELGRMPLRHRWHKQTLRFWNRLLVADKSDLLWAAFCKGARLARDVSESEPANCSTWCCHVQNLNL